MNGMNGPFILNFSTLEASLIITFSNSSRLGCSIQEALNCANEIQGKS